VSGKNLRDRSDEDSACSKYYWTGGEKGYKVKERKGLNPKEKGLSDEERTERRTIKEWEGRLEKPDMEQLSEDSDIVAYCLSPPLRA
jgi:hypothetical protein